MAERKPIKKNQDEAEQLPAENRAVPDATLADLDDDKLAAYQAQLDEGDQRGAGGEDRLAALGLTRTEGNSIRPTTAALLLFGKNPQQFLPHTSLKLARFKGADVTDLILDRAELFGTLDKLIEDAARFVARNMRVSGRIEGVYREDVPEYPITAVREAIANAVAHRDYATNGQKIAVRMFDDRLEVESPGGLAGPVTLANLGQKRYSRNPLLTRLMYEMRLVEEMGTGIKRMRRTLAELGSDPPRFTSDADSFLAVLPALKLATSQTQPIAKNVPESNAIAAVFEITDDNRIEYFALLRAGLNDRQAKGLLYARQLGRITNKDYRAVNPDITDETARLDLVYLVDKGYLMKFGDRKGAAYLPR